MFNLLKIIIDNHDSSIIMSNRGRRYEQMFIETQRKYSKITFQEALSPKIFLNACMKSLNVADFDDENANFDSLAEIVTDNIAEGDGVCIIITCGMAFSKNVPVEFLYILFSWDQINCFCMKNNASSLMILDMDT
jgi:hypothetical protein